MEKLFVLIIFLLFYSTSYGQKINKEIKQQWIFYVENYCLKESHYFNIFNYYECKKKLYKSELTYSHWQRFLFAIDEISLHQYNLEIEGVDWLAWPDLIDNNCYNYALNQKTNGFNSPGGKMSWRKYDLSSCYGDDDLNQRAGLVDAVVADGGKITEDFHRCPKDNRVIALFAKNANGSGFHFLRLEKNGFWTHKPGDSHPTKYDNNNKLITDPRESDVGYSTFCAFFCIDEKKVKLSDSNY